MNDLIPFLIKTAVILAWLSLFVEQPPQPMKPNADGFIPVRRELMK